MATLFNLTQDFNAAYNDLLDMDLSDDEIIDKLAIINADIQHKALNIAKIIKEMDNIVASIKQRISDLGERSKKFENRSSRLHKYLRENLEVVGIEKVQDEEVTVSFKKNPPRVDIVDQTLIPPAYFTAVRIPPPVLDRRKVIESWKAGTAVPGTRLVQEKRMQIDD